MFLIRPYQYSWQEPIRVGWTKGSQVTGRRQVGRRSQAMMLWLKSGLISWSEVPAASQERYIPTAPPETAQESSILPANNSLASPTPRLIGDYRGGSSRWKNICNSKPVAAPCSSFFGADLGHRCLHWSLGRILISPSSAVG